MLICSVWGIKKVKLSDNSNAVPVILNGVKVLKIHCIAVFPVQSLLCVCVGGGGGWGEGGGGKGVGGRGWSLH